MAYAPSGAPDGSFLETVLSLPGDLALAAFPPAKGKYRPDF